MRPWHLLGAALLVLALDATAHHQGDHRVVAVGVWTEALIRFGACDTADQAQSVAEAHRDQGVDAARALWIQLNETPGAGGMACGTITGAFMVTDVLSRMEIDGARVTVVQFAVISRAVGAIPSPLYGILHGVEVVQTEAELENPV